MRMLSQTQPRTNTASYALLRAVRLRRAAHESMREHWRPVRYLDTHAKHAAALRCTRSRKQLRPLLAPSLPTWDTARMRRESWDSSRRKPNVLHLDLLACEPKNNA
jgi:hypothetical protein